MEGYIDLALKRHCNSDMERETIAACSLMTSSKIDQEGVHQYTGDFNNDLV